MKKAASHLIAIAVSVFYLFLNLLMGAHVPHDFGRYDTIFDNILTIFTFDNILIAIFGTILGYIILNWTNSDFFKTTDFEAELEEKERQKLFPVDG